MKIRYVIESDIEFLSKYDRHISKDELESIINQKRVIIYYYLMNH